ncbi:AzlC family ABC transporter permease [Streptomyces sp. I05A-00742]|uniref:AzlC family ABC transporter permease n=1 Tax=Streptomyces sp. I05A-00742 TaxID=2732853 RepID=UPI0014895E20|nr:AzlC family ABC transporter permease [Streptomyces sp. I05A-00742]
MNRLKAKVSATTQGGDADWPRQKAALLRDSAGVGLAVGALGLSFGALAVLAGFTVAQSCVLSLLMFSGASQFAVIGVLGAGGSPLTGAATAGLLGVRNSLYGLTLSRVLRVRGARRALAAHLVLDESSGMAMGRPTERASRLAFWATGTAVFVCWNLATLAGAVGAEALPDPTALGLDVASPAAFIALLMPRLRGPRLWAVAGAAAVTALATTLVLPAGVPVLVAGLVACSAGLVTRRRRSGGGAPKDVGEREARGRGAEREAARKQDAERCGDS